MYEVECSFTPVPMTPRFIYVSDRKRKKEKKKLREKKKKKKEKNRKKEEIEKIVEFY